MNKAIIDRPNVFKYENLQQFIADYVLYLKLVEKTPKTKVAKRAGFGSPSYLKMIMDGERNLTPKSALQLAKAFRLNKDETECFSLLVRLSQSRNDLEASSYRASLRRFRDFYELKEVDRDYYDLFSKWYFTAILEFIGSAASSWQEETLATALNLSVDEVKVSIALLERLGLIQRQGDTWVRTSAAIQTPKKVASQLVHGHTREMIQQALEHLNEEDPDRRNFQTLTVPLTVGQFRNLTERIWNFLTEINLETNSTKDPDGIYQLNVQLFSLLQNPKRQEAMRDAS